MKNVNKEECKLWKNLTNEEKKLIATAEKVFCMQVTGNWSEWVHPTAHRTFSDGLVYYGQIKEESDKPKETKIVPLSMLTCPEMPWAVIISFGEAHKEIRQVLEINNAGFNTYSTHYTWFEAANNPDLKIYSPNGNHRPLQFVEEPPKCTTTSSKPMPTSKELADNLKSLFSNVKDAKNKPKSTEQLIFENWFKEAISNRNAVDLRETEKLPIKPVSLKFGDICPSCGKDTLDLFVFTESSILKCKKCGFEGHF